MQPDGHTRIYTTLTDATITFDACAVLDIQAYHPAAGFARLWPFDIKLRHPFLQIAALQVSVAIGVQETHLVD